jgi:osmotically-inducible protein OsmY
MPHDRINVTVRNGWITLEGDVDWQFQKEAAESAVRYLSGVKGITNLITVMPRVSALVVKEKIEEALRRNVELDARRITVETTNGKVIIRGTVRARVEREEAERAAWSAPGVKEVEDDLVVAP